MRHCNGDVHLGANEPECSCTSLYIGISAPAELKYGCCGSIIQMEMDETALELRHPCSKGSHGIDSLEVANGVFFMNKLGRNLV